ncbi:FxSxx-COOH cyclophane-containing RiPP peptide [Parafrankia sp. FMc2]|uniref:FxSxx-COOH cyclophane-containing RiPP peptide n=1 Tax=Parafrankia sp. FMc2 TaxID=3233196 RepID=UPI0034D39CDD
MEAATGDIVSEMADLTRADLDGLVLTGDPNTVLSRSLRRLVRDIEHPGEALAGFQSSI